MLPVPAEQSSPAKGRERFERIISHRATWGIWKYRTQRETISKRAERKALYGTQMDQRNAGQSLGSRGRALKSLHSAPEMCICLLLRTVYAQYTTLEALLRRCASVKGLDIPKNGAIIVSATIE